MIRGISFLSSLQFDHFLSRLPFLMDVKPYDWMIDETEIYNPGQPEGRFSGDVFEELMKTGDEYNFVRIRRYPVGAEIQDVVDYEEYLKSECSFVLLCCDGGFYEIYDKNEAEIMTIHDECMRIGCEKIEITTDENDGRYIFHL